MGFVRNAFVLSLLLFALPRAVAQECSSAKLSATDVLETVQVYSNEYALDDDHVSYEIAPTAPSNSFDQVSDPIRVLTNNQSACPASCTVTLDRYTDTFQGNQSTILFFDTEHSFYLPSHYVKDNKTTFVCVSANGSCGATVPIYRYYKISNGGVYHAYAFEQDVVYDGYNQEFLPICYAWPLTTGTVASRPTCGTLNFDTPLSALSDLKVYDNNIDGIERDHYYTTLASSDSSLAGYNQTGVLGKVLTSSKSTACSCLVKLQQQFDNQTGYFHRLDHKLIVTGQEPNRPYEEYVDTGETIYCAKRLGDCGATLPLWKHFQFYDVDTVYTTDSSPLPMSYLYPQVPLCYIWPSSYSPNASNIPSVTPAQSPFVTLPPTVATGTVGTTGGVSQSTVSSATTPLADAGGVTPLVVATQSTASTGSPLSTISTSATAPTVSVWGTAGSTSPGSASASTVSVWGTASPTTPSPTASASTVSVWGTASPTTPSTGGPSTVSLWGTVGSTPTGSNSASTVSVWGTASPTTPTTGQSTISVWGTTPSPGASASTVSVWGTASPTTPTTGGPSTISVWGTVASTPTGSNSASTVSVWGTASPTTPTTGQSTISVWGTTPNPNSPVTAMAPNSASSSVATTQSTVSVWGTASSTTPSHLSDGGAATVASLAVTSTSKPIGSNLSATTEAYISTELPLEDDGSVTLDPTAPETFTLSDFWYLTTQTTKPPGTLPPSTPGTTHSAGESTGTTAGTVPPTVMITGPLFNSGSQQLVTVAPVASAVSTVPTSATSSGTPVPSTPSPQHIAAAPTYSIVGGPLNQFTNPPIIEALISVSSNPSTVARKESSSTSSPESEEQSQPVKRDAVPTSTTTTTEAPGIIWKAGDWISTTWHSIFGGGDMPTNSTSSTATPSGNLTTTTPRPMGGLVGSLINSTGNFFNDTKAFLGNTINSATGTNSSSPVSNFLNKTGDFIDQTLNSNGTSSGSFINNTKNWIDDKWDSTGEFLSNAWNSLGSSNDTAGSFVNNTKTWVGGAVNSTGQFISGAWNDTKEHTGNFLNSSQTWIGDQLNGTAIGTFMNTTGGAIAGNVTSAIGSLIGGAGDVLGKVGEAINGSNATVSNGTSYAAAPLSNAVGGVASAILAPVSTTQPPNLKVEWNGGRVEGPLTG